MTDAIVTVTLICLLLTMEFILRLITFEIYECKHLHDDHCARAAHSKVAATAVAVVIVSLLGSVIAVVTDTVLRTMAFLCVRVVCARVNGIENELMSETIIIVSNNSKRRMHL